MKRHVSSFFLILCLSFSFTFSGCQTAPTTPEREPASTLFPEWILSGLGGNFKLKGEPDMWCLQRYIDRIGESNGVSPEPFLGKRIIDVAIAMKLDPYIFAGLIQQETGNFDTHRGKNGVGVTQMTNAAIRDACLALEGTECARPQANPKYLKIWEDLFSKGVETLFGSRDVQWYYPWRSQCFLYEHRCESNCGIDNSCIQKVRTKIYEDARISILMGAFTLANKLAEAKANNKKLVGQELYREALRRYNGHPDYKVKYANLILDRHVPAILTACPAMEDVDLVKED